MFGCPSPRLVETLREESAFMVFNIVRQAIEKVNIQFVNFNATMWGYWFVSRIVGSSTKLT
jgi:hypothetical protein